MGTFDVWSVPRAIGKHLLGIAACDVPEDLDAVTVVGDEVAPESVGSKRDEIERLWEKTQAVYRSGMHPAIQLCIRRRGEVVLNRAIGHARGNSPDDTADTPKVPIALDTPVTIYSASKAITAMVVHKLDEKGVLRRDDWVSEYIPEFARHGKEQVSIRHVLAHRAGIPNLPPESLDLELLRDPHHVVELLCDAKLTSRPGRVVAYHAITGGFVLGEVVERATGKGLREVLHEEISGPMGIDLEFGAPGRAGEVAVNAFTGPPVPLPFDLLLKRALGASLPDVVDLSNDPRFLEAVIPSANVVTNAHDLCAFYQCLLDEGRWRGRDIFDRRTVRHATSEQSWWEIDFTLVLPIRYGLGFMLGSEGIGLFGADNPRAFGHLGLSNIFSWADPERDLSVALITTGKPVLGSHVVALFDLVYAIGRVFEKTHAGHSSGSANGRVLEAV